MKLKLLDEGDWSREEVEESIREIISENQLLSMATADGKDPHINTAFYAFDDELNLYILTPPETRHGENLEENNSVAVDVHDSHQNGRTTSKDSRYLEKQNRLKINLKPFNYTKTVIQNSESSQPPPKTWKNSTQNFT